MVTLDEATGLAGEQRGCYILGVVLAAGAIVLLAR